MEQCIATNREKERERECFRILLNRTKVRFSELYSLFTQTTDSLWQASGRDTLIIVHSNQFSEEVITSAGEENEATNE